MFNRPFDNQDNIRVRLETESKLHIQELIKSGGLDLVWSYILAYENSQNPFFERRFAIEKWKNLSQVLIGENQEIKNYAKKLMEQNIKLKDSLHIACAVNAQAEYFLSTDNKLLNKMQSNNDIVALNPIDFIRKINQ